MSIKFKEMLKISIRQRQNASTSILLYAPLAPALLGFLLSEVEEFVLLACGLHRARWANKT